MSRSVEVLLVSMPFAPLSEPSLGLSLLKASLPGASCRILYSTLSFAERLGAPVYRWIAEGNPSTTALAGEWIFSEALAGKGVTDSDVYLDRILRREADREPIAADQERILLAARRAAGGFLEECCESVLGHRPRIVGFTSVFQQHAASLALARRLKERSPATAIVLGGANCEAAMGLQTARSFPWLDAVVSGEGEPVFPELVSRILAGRSYDDLPGVLTRTSREVADAPRTRDLDELPLPDYDDFFEQWRSKPFANDEVPGVTLETSRGCWWGEKQHCTFCGLNGLGMTFRGKSASRAQKEIEGIRERYPGSPIRIVDNILDMKYFKTLLPELARRAGDLDLFFEVKANLKKGQVRLLRAAGVTRIQPGIESLSDSVLRRMRKGVTALQSIQLLKWCREVGIRPFWNLIWGFPGEDPAEYARMAELIPWLTHLAPPDHAVPIRLDRFSPNYELRDEMGFAEVEPCPAYRHVYALDDDALANLAYFFSYRHRDGRDVAAYTRPVADQVEIWRAAYPRSTLFFLDKGDRLLVWDSRPAAVSRLSVLEGLEREIYLACDTATGVAQLASLTGAAAEQVETALRTLTQHKLLLVRNGRALSLALPSGSG